MTLHGRLAVLTVAGLLVAYLLMDVGDEGKTSMRCFRVHDARWPKQLGFGFVLVTLVSEAALLVIAAQAGLWAVPRLLANMALGPLGFDPVRHLSDRLVTQNGVLLMGAAALTSCFLSRGSVPCWVVPLQHQRLHHLHPLPTRHGAALVAEPGDRAGLAEENPDHGIGFGLTLFILISLSVRSFTRAAG